MTVFMTGKAGMQEPPWRAYPAGCISRQLLLLFEEADMNDLHSWLSQQHHGLRTFKNFQQQLDTLSAREPAQQGLCALLSRLVGGYIEAYDEAPLPVAIADRAYGRLLDLVGSLDFEADADRRLADINRVAASSLLH
jgi:hypothetical protein